MSDGTKPLIRLLKEAGLDFDSALVVSAMVDEQKDREAMTRWMLKHPKATTSEIVHKANEIMKVSLYSK